jgi:hypothetical protein
MRYGAPDLGGIALAILARDLTFEIEQEELKWAA